MVIQMKKIIILLFMITLVTFFCNNKKENIIIPNNAIRFRIIANSDSTVDQELKKTIKNDINKNFISKINANSKQNTEKQIKTNLTSLDNILKKYNVEYNINYGQNYFPKKIYRGIQYNEGLYDSLVITLGNGLGANWWCVMFPPLCLLEADENNYSDIDYQLYIKKIISNKKNNS